MMTPGVAASLTPRELKGRSPRREPAPSTQRRWLRVPHLHLPHLHLPHLHLPHRHV